MSQLIDIEAAKEFMKEILDRISRENLVTIANDLQAKSSLFQQRLHSDRIHQLTDSEVEEILNNIFVARKRCAKIIETNPHEKLRNSIHDLLYGAGEVEERFQSFVNSMNAMERHLKTEIAGEILHFTNPDKYWLCSRWMWDPVKKTGALPLVTEEGFDLQGKTEGEVYMKVGKGVAFVHSIAEAADFQFISRSLFGTDVFLASVYVVYAYTVLRMRMTQEFNKVMPGLNEFARRILGIHKLPQAA